MIAALFVESGGVYTNITGVSVWDIQRDARKYNERWPVIAHPPCERWGRYWSGGPSAKIKRRLGDDDGCFESALYTIRRVGGVLEHPEASKAWEFFGLKRPPRYGGWVPADDVGWTCCVEQGHYGHPARKATWLYTVKTSRPELVWGPCLNKTRLDEGFHSQAERYMARHAGRRPIPRLSKQQCVSTPVGFRDLLIGLAESVAVQ